LVLEKQALAIVTLEFPELAKTYEPGPELDPGTESLRGHGDAADPRQDEELQLPGLQSTCVLHAVRQPRPRTGPARSVTRLNPVP
jgi:hypothetical protein